MIGNMTFRIVLDTNVVVAGLRSAGGASHRLLREIAGERFDLLISVPLLFEYESVLNRPDVLSQTGLKRAEISEVLSFWAAKCTPVKFHYLWRPMLRDSSDEMVLETAVNGGADFLVTFNLRDFAVATNLFNLEVVTPAEFLHYLKVKR